MTTDLRDPFEYYPEWREDAACAQPETNRLYFTERDIWFHVDADEEGYDPQQKERDEVKALSICFDCPVRDLCLRDALEDKEAIYGTRGGNTESMIRAALSVDETGKEIRRGDFPDCPYCGAATDALVPTKIELPDGGRWSEAKAVKCGECGFEWKSRSSHNSVVAYFNEQKKKAEQERREAIARERLSI
ncbi:WhiB family transcription factor [Microbacterium phage PauloDiaboli]|nr:WhiB family transcription factor [Microbacterium phage PauloDiaboli]